MIDRARTLFFELFRFGIVGVIGLLINIFVVYAARPVLNLQLCGVLGFLVAATGTWVLHRNFTFKPISTKPAPIYRQWLAFLTVNAAGGGIYILVFYVLTKESPLCLKYPFIAVCAGGILGMGINFTLSKTMVFSNTRYRRVR